MSPDERARIDDLDRFWDRLVQDGSADACALDPGLVRTVRWIDAGRAEQPPPAGAMERIRDRAWAVAATRRAIGEVWSPVSIGGHGEVSRSVAPGSRLGSGRREWALTHLATAALLLVTVAAVAVAFGGLRTSAPGEHGPADALPVRGNAAHTGEMPGPGPAGSPVARWQAALDGPVFSQPAVDADRVYVAAGNTLTAVDRATAKVRWTFAATDQLISGPAIAGDLVEVVEDGGTLHAVERTTGHERWHTDLGPMRYCASVLAAANGLLYVSGTRLVAVDAATGAVRWTAPAPIGSGRLGMVSSPAVAVGRVFVGSADGSLYALDAATGAVAWRFATGSSVSTSPAVVAGVVYFGNDAGTVYAVAAQTGALVWTAKPGRWLDASSPAVAGGRVFVVAEKRVLVALDAATGRELWRFATKAGSGGWPVVAGDVVYLGSDERILYALDAATGTERWRYSFAGKIESEPAVTGGLVYVGDDWNTLYALGDRGPGP